MNDILKAMKGATITFDPTRCNHMGKIISECPPCLRHRIADLESQLAESQRREGLLRAVAMQTQHFVYSNFKSDLNGASKDGLLFMLKEWLQGLDSILQAAIEGGAMGGENEIS